MAKEYLPENEEPVNQLSKKALSKLKVKYGDESLYMVQLMLWVLRERREIFNRNNYPDLLDQVEYLERQEPKRALNYLLKEDEAGFGLFKAKPLESLAPEELAVNLINQLHDLMASSDTGYPPKGFPVVSPRI